MFIEAITCFFATWAACMLISVTSSARNLKKRAFMVEQKIDLLLKNARVEYDPYSDIPNELTEVIHSGDKIRAIKLYQKATATGWWEAKRFVEEAERRNKSSA